MARLQCVEKKKSSLNEYRVGTNPVYLTSYICMLTILIMGEASFMKKKFFIRAQRFPVTFLETNHLEMDVEPTF